MTPFIYPIPGGGGGGPVYETRFGAGAPAGGLGNVGDVYFDTTSKAIYKKTGPAVWTLQSSYALAVKDEGGLLSGTVGEINFAGSDVQASLTAPGVVRVEVPTPPPPPFGIFAGGSGNGGVPAYKRTDKLDFANDAVAMVAQPDLATARDDVSGHHSSLAGYVSGGFAPFDSVTEKFVFAGLVWGVAGSLSLGTRSAYGAYNSSTRGYVSGGKLIGTETTTTESLDYSNDALAMTSKGALAQARYFCASAQSSLKGYTAGGVKLGGGFTALSSCEALTYATDGVAMVAAGALGATRDFQATVNSGTIGYWCGGENGSTPYQSQIYALTFATDLVAMVNKGSLVLPARGGMAGANSLTLGYIAGGVTAGVVTSCQSLAFASDTSALVSKGALSLARASLAGMQSGGIL